MTDGEALGDEIAGLAGRLNAAHQRLSSCIRRFDELEEWYRQGALSCAHWLTWRIGLAPVAAREKVRVARALGSLPRIDEAFANGRLSYSQVRAVTRIASPTNEKMILEVALVATGAQLERICRGYRTATEGEKEAAQDRRVRARPLGSGLVKLEVVLSADEADRWSRRSIGCARNWCRRRPRRKPRRVRRARRTSRWLQMRRRGRRQRTRWFISPRRCWRRLLRPRARSKALQRLPDRCQVVIHVDRDLSSPESGLRASLEDGTHVSAETLRRVCCDGGLVTAAVDEQGAVLDVGRKTRAIPTAIRRALSIRDQGCRFPGCSNQRFLHGHHVQHWLHGGRTSLENLVLLCSSHHRQIHEGGYSLRLTADGGVEVRTPKGATLPAQPALAPDVGSVDWWSDWWGGGSGTQIDAWTATPSWGGEQPDYTWIVDGMAMAPPEVS